VQIKIKFVQNSKFKAFSFSPDGAEEEKGGSQRMEEGNLPQ